MFLFYILFGQLASAGPCGARGPCGDYHNKAERPMSLSCECSNVLDGWEHIDGYRLDSTWMTFANRLQECVSWCLSAGCADGETGAYNTCGPCIWSLWPYTENNCGGDQTECCKGTNPKLYPTLSTECLCPFEKRPHPTLDVYY